MTCRRKQAQVIDVVGAACSATRDQESEKQFMNIEMAPETRAAFRDWLRGELRRLEFYNRRSDHYLIREFHKYCAEKGQDIDEASLGRYLRDENPVIPTPERCRALAAMFKIPAIEVMKHAGLVMDSDMMATPLK